MLVEQRPELRDGVQPRILIRRPEPGEVGSEGRDPVLVPLLEPGDRTVPLPLDAASRALDARSPGELVQRVEGSEIGERRLSAGAAREGPTGPDVRGVEAKGPEEAVDVVRCTGGRRPRRLVGRDQTLAGGGDDRELGGGEIDGQDGSVVRSPTR